jgi:hypothetical protein
VCPLAEQLDHPPPGRISESGENWIDVITHRENN